jgi:hypothetical protein
MAKAAASPLQHQPSNKPMLLIPEKRVRCMKTQHSEHTYTILHQAWCSAWQHNNSRNSIYFSLTAYKQSAFAIAAVVSKEKSIVPKTAQYMSRDHTNMTNGVLVYLEFVQVRSFVTDRLQRKKIYMFSGGFVNRSSFPAGAGASPRRAWRWRGTRRPPRRGAGRPKEWSE